MREAIEYFVLDQSEIVQIEPSDILFLIAFYPFIFSLSHESSVLNQIVLSLLVLPSTKRTKLIMMLMLPYFFLPIRGFRDGVLVLPWLLPVIQHQPTE